MTIKLHHTHIQTLRHLPVICTLTRTTCRVLSHSGMLPEHINRGLCNIVKQHWHLLQTKHSGTVVTAVSRTHSGHATDLLQCCLDAKHTRQLWLWHFFKPRAAWNLKRDLCSTVHLFICPSFCPCVWTVLRLTADTPTVTWRKSIEHKKDHTFEGDLSSPLDKAHKTRHGIQHKRFFHTT